MSFTGATPNYEKRTFEKKKEVSLSIDNKMKVQFL